MKHIYIVFILLQLTATPLISQKLPRLPQHTFNTTLLNPAARPLENILDPLKQDIILGIAHRQQWTNRDGPKHISVRFDWSNTQPEKWLAGAGIDLLSYQTDPLRQNAISGRISFQHNIFKRWKMAVGFSSSFSDQEIDKISLLALHPTDPALGALPARQSKLSIGFGLFTYCNSPFKGHSNSESIWFGISMPQTFIQPLQHEQPQLIPVGWGKGPLYIMTGMKKQLTQSCKDCFRLYTDIDILSKYEQGLLPFVEPALKFGLANTSDGEDISIQFGYSFFSSRVFFINGGYQRRIYQTWYLRLSGGYDFFTQRYNVIYRTNFEINLALYRRR